MATTKYGSTWTGTYSGGANRYFRAYCTYITSETDTTFTLSVSALGIQKTSGGQCEMASGTSKTAKLTASGAYIKSGNPISKSSTALISWDSGSQYKSLGSGTIVFNKTASAQTATLTLYADKSGGDTSTAWGGKSTGTFTITIPAITRTITYSADGGTGAPSAAKAVNGSEYTLSTLIPVKEGYDFTGWSDGTNVYAAGSTYTISADVTFTAQWHASFVAPQISNLRAYRTASASSDAATYDGTYGYVAYYYTPPKNAKSQSVAVRFSTDTADITGTPVSGANGVHGTKTIPTTSSATVTVTVSGQTYNGTPYSISSTTYISQEIDVWDAYIDPDNKITSFSIGGVASETESRFDVKIPSHFNNSSEFNDDVFANKIKDYGFATGNLAKLLNHLGAGYKWHANVNDSNGAGEMIIGNLKIAYGYASIKPSKALTSTYKTVNLGCTFGDSANVYLTQYGAPQIATLILSVSETGTTTFKAHIYASNTTSRAFRWLAIGKAPDDEAIKNLT